MELFGAVYCVLLFLSSHTQGSNVELVEKDSKFERRDVDTCVDNSLCATLPDICTNLDQALVKSLCPAKCGLCPTQGTCTPTYCQHNGVCLLVVGKPVCGCPSEYTGAHCEIEPKPTTTTTASPTTSSTTTTASLSSTVSGACDLNPCLNGGHCKDTNGGFVCLCLPGFEHPVCSPATPPSQQPPTATSPATTKKPTPNCYIVGQEFMYVGKENKTEDGVPCEKWTAHVRSEMYSFKDFTDGLAGYNSNFCRENVHLLYEKHYRPWCYTGPDDDDDWGYCDIPICSVTG